MQNLIFFPRVEFLLFYYYYYFGDLIKIIFENPILEILSFINFFYLILTKFSFLFLVKIIHLLIDNINT